MNRSTVDLFFKVKLGDVKKALQAVETFAGSFENFELFDMRTDPEGTIAVALEDWDVPHEFDDIMVKFHKWWREHYDVVPEGYWIENDAGEVYRCEIDLADKVVSACTDWLSSLPVSEILYLKTLAFQRQKKS